MLWADTRKRCNFECPLPDMMVGSLRDHSRERLGLANLTIPDLDQLLRTSRTTVCYQALQGQPTQHGHPITPSCTLHQKDERYRKTRGLSSPSTRSTLWREFSQYITPSARKFNLRSHTQRTLSTQHLENKPLRSTTDATGPTCVRQYMLATKLDKTLPILLSFPVNLPGPFNSQCVITSFL